MSVAKVILFVALLVVLYQETTACTDNFDCYGSDVCCTTHNVCRDDCVGKSCAHSSDCGGYGEYCCDSKCQKGFCGLAAWVVTVIVLCVLGGIAAVVGVVLCIYCSYRRRSPGVIVAVPAVTVPAATVVAGSNRTNYAHGQLYPIGVVQPPQPNYGPPPYYQPPQTQK